MTDKKTISQESFETPQGVFDGKPDVASDNLPAFKPATKVPVGGEILSDTPVEYNKNRKTVRLSVRNTGDRPIQVGSHFHFFEVNRYLLFDRDKAFGYHLNIPSTTAIRFEPGDQKEVELVTYSGKRRVVGFNGLVNGYAGGEDSPTYFPVRIKALAKMRRLGFGLIDQTEAEKSAKPADNSKKQKH